MGGGDGLGRNGGVVGVRFLQIFGLEGFSMNVSKAMRDWGVPELGKIVRASAVPRCMCLQGKQTRSQSPSRKKKAILVPSLLVGSHMLPACNSGNPADAAADSVCSGGSNTGPLDQDAERERRAKLAEDRMKALQNRGYVALGIAISIKIPTILVTPFAHVGLASNATHLILI